MKKNLAALHLLYLLPAVDGLLQPDQLHGQSVSVETQCLGGTRHLLNWAELPAAWKVDKSESESALLVKFACGMQGIWVKTHGLRKY